MKTKLISLLALITLTFAPASLLFQTAYAACPTTPGDSRTQVLIGINQTGGDCNETQVTSTISTAVNLISYVAGVVAIIMVIVSGFKFMTSAGDAGKVASARSTLVYALIGIGVAALAQIIVHFVLANVPKS